MKYEALAESLIERYNSEEIIEEGLPAVLAWLALGMGASKAFNWYINTFESGQLPELLTQYKDSGWWIGLSVFDFTGLMSQASYREAMQEAEANPNDQWAYIKMWLMFMATVPGTHINPFRLFRAVGSLLGKAFNLKGAVIAIFNKLGNMFRATTVGSETLPTLIAKMSHEGKDALQMKKMIEGAFNVKISDDAIAAAAKKNNWKLAPGLVKVTSAISDLAGAGLKGAAKMAGQAGKILGVADIFKKKDRQLTARTPDVMGPKVQFGTIGGGVE